MKHACVSVVLPVRNACATLTAAVQSIQNQTFRDWELLLVDDGSDDGSRDLARSLSVRDLRIRPILLSPVGLVAALNEGLERAGSEFIARMDADDESHSQRFEKQLTFLRTHPDIGVVGCGVEYGGDRARSEGYALHVDWLNTLGPPASIRIHRFVESPLAHPCVMFRKQLVSAHGGYVQGAFPEDYELWLRWLDAGVEMARIPETLFTWNDPPGRLSRHDSRYEPTAFARLKAEYLARELKRSGGGREIWVWGAGRPTRKRAEFLTTHGIRIKGYIDIDPAKTGTVLQNRPVMGKDQIPSSDQAVIVSFVSNRGARDLIREFLISRGWAEGCDFWMAA